MRQFYCDCWNKAQTGQPLEPLELQIAAVIKEHPEYHALLENVDKAKSREYLPEMNETNPFLHMSMHLGIREQVGMNSPAGINELIQKIALKVGDHEAEHQVMDCLAEVIWQAQRSATTPDDAQYLKCIKEVLLKS
ncbi:MAG TPA: DUF1841 family protein [Thiothrix sp.]|nr:DUF1841 family protein [Thiothrix sp.]